MSLVQAILKGMSDDEIADSNVVIPTPVRELMKRYNRIALNDDDLLQITETTTGKELKAAIEMMEPEMQLVLLNTYVHAQRAAIDFTTSQTHAFEFSLGQTQLGPAPATPATPTETETPDQRDKRQFRLFAKVSLLFFFCGVLMVSGGALMFAMFTGSVGWSAWNKTFFITVSQIANLIFTHDIKP